MSFRHAPGKVIAVMPAYNAARTLERTLADIPPGAVDEIILVDEKNKGYGGNQKTCYREALARGADYIVMIHPDYQYDSRVIGATIEFLMLGICDVMMGSRIRTRREALAGGMPAWKYIANRML